MRDRRSAAHVMNKLEKTVLHLNQVRSVLAAGLLMAGMQPAMAQDNAFAPGWTMDPAASALQFQSVKNETKVESSTFATYTGTIDETGLATVRVLMDSVNTNVDLRNVRMRFLMFETFQYPEAVITMQIDPATLADLEVVRRKSFVAPYTISLHGVSAESEADIVVTLLDDDRVLVSAAKPLTLLMSDFNLDGGVAKLEEAAKVDILPFTTVTFDFIFDRAESASDYIATSAALAADAGLNAAAMEEEGDFSLEACMGRFDTMSQSNSVYFATGSSRLESRSEPVLDSIVEIVGRCPELSIQVGGHTDSDGTEAENLALSEARARAVRTYLVDAGADGDRIEAVGYGESLPVVENDSSENKARNRRIEFTIIGG